MASNETSSSGETGSGVDGSGSASTGADTVGAGPWCGVEPPASGGRAPSVCDDPQPVVQLDAEGQQQPTGYERCGSGVVHRIEQVACIVEGIAGTCDFPDDPSGSCMADADCVDAPNGRCNGQGMDGSCGCDYPCSTDADCGPDQACYCAGAYSHCVMAHCRTDADCGDHQCVYSPYHDALACQTAFDTCRADSECIEGDCPNCAYDVAACAWSCEPSFDACTAGRPLLVQGQAVVAGVVPREDWAASSRAVDCSIGACAHPAVLAEHWGEIAATEHASVAAFARFGLQLLALGAPAALVEQATTAMADEIVHAREAFALASRFAGRKLGPGPLSIEGVLASVDAVEIALEVVHEGCIAETLAALEAAEAARHAEDPWVRDVLQRIAADELRHAELAWRFVAWVLPRVGSVEQDRIVTALRSALAAAARAPIAGTGDASLRGFGLLDTGLRRVIRREGCTNVIAPTIETLAAQRCGAEGRSHRALREGGRARETIG